MPPSEAGGRLLASIHDVSPRFESAIALLHDRLEGLLGSPRFAMLVVPDFWNAARLSPRSAFAARLRAWSDRGVEIFLHGWSHRDEKAHPRLVDRLRARHLSAREAEFIDLDGVEAGRRIREGRALLEDIIGRPVTGFVAPCWLYGRGTIEALARESIAVAEDHWRIWNPVTGERLARAPVVTWASRSRARIASSLGFAHASPLLLRGFATVRIAVHPGDVGVPALLSSIDRTIAAFAARRAIAGYAELAVGQGNA